MIGIEPDRTFIIDMDPELALSRGLARATDEQRFEGMGLDLQIRLRAGFRALAEARPRCVLIDGNRAPAEVAADVAAHL